MTNPIGRPRGKPQPHLVKYPGILAIQRRAYSRMRSQAKYRRELWSLTWDEFFEIWASLWDLRGSGREQLCLSRIDPAQAWTVDNVEIITREQHWLRQKENKYLK
jgi:hypothetical protein